MGICSYCGRQSVLTREHIIPSWYYRHDPRPDDSGFMERAKGKIVKTELTIRDVCSDCNGGPLSELDSYGMRLFFSDFQNYIYTDTEHTFAYDHDLLCRWLLKVAYNSARAHGTDIEVLTHYKDIILGNQPIPTELLIHLRTIAPTTEGVYSVGPASTKSTMVVDNPEWFRVGVFRLKDFDSIYWSFRHVTINSYSFLLCVPSLASHEPRKEFEHLREALRQDNGGGVTLDKRGQQVLPRPIIDSVTYSLQHFGQYPLTYELIESESLKTAMDSRFGLVNYWIDRKDIEAKNFGNVLAFLADLICSREVALGMRDRVEFSAHGYDNDPRELYEIPEVVEYLRRLDEMWPFWMLFQHPKFKWLQLLGVCLSDGKRKEAPVDPGETRKNKYYVEFDGPMLAKNMERWFVALNELCHRFAISVEINKAVSAKAERILTGDFAGHQPVQ